MFTFIRQIRRSFTERAGPLRLLAGVAIFATLVPSIAFGEVHLHDKWVDSSRAETNLPKEAAVWVGRTNDVTVNPGRLSTAMTLASQKIWTYFTDKDPVTLRVGEMLTARVSFVPRGALRETTSRSFRIGLFHDATSPRVETDVNSDAGGDDSPWSDAKGYAVQSLVTGGEYSSTKPFDLGKRTNLESESLLGTSGDYTKVSGGDPVTLELDKEYTVSLQVRRVAQEQTELTAEYRQGDEILSTWTVTDDRNTLGPDPIYDQFDLLYIRISNNATTADRIDFTRFGVEHGPAEGQPQTR